MSKTQLNLEQGGITSKSLKLSYKNTHLCLDKYVAPWKKNVPDNFGIKDDLDLKQCSEESSEDDASVSSRSSNGFTANPQSIYLLKVNNRNTRTRREICSKLIIKTLERRQLYTTTLWLTLNIFRTFFYCFYRYLWAGKCRLGTHTGHWRTYWKKDT